MSFVNNFDMKYISLIFQNISRIVLIYFFIFIWLRYLLSSLWLSLLLSALITIFCDIMLRVITRKKDKHLNMKIKEKEDAENMFLSLATSENVDFFLELAKIENLNAFKKKKYIILPNKEQIVLLYPFLSLNAITNEDISSILKIAQKEKATKIVIVCGEISKEAFNLSNSLDKNILILDKFSSFSQLYQFYDKYPKITMTYKKSKKLAFKELFAYSFNRSRTKGYLLSAFVLFVSTLFIRLNIYYCITASLLVLFALISYLNPYFNTKKAAKPLS